MFSLALRLVQGADPTHARGRWSGGAYNSPSRKGRYDFHKSQSVGNEIPTTGETWWCSGRSELKVTRALKTSRGGGSAVVLWSQLVRRARLFWSPDLACPTGPEG